jgi:hypothetical protein
MACDAHLSPSTSPASPEKSPNGALCVTSSWRARVQDWERVQEQWVLEQRSLEQQVLEQCRCLFHGRAEDRIHRQIGQKARAGMRLRKAPSVRWPGEDRERSRPPSTLDSPASTAGGGSPQPPGDEYSPTALDHNVGAEAFDAWASRQRRRATRDGAWKVEVSERVVHGALIRSVSSWHGFWSLLQSG